MRSILGYTSHIVGNKYVLFIIRFILGAILISAAAGKVPEQAKFVDAVTDLGLLPHGLSQAYGLFLPWLELTLGLCFVLGLLTRIVAGISILMTVSFIIANGTSECVFFP